MALTYPDLADKVLKLVQRFCFFKYSKHLATIFWPSLCFVWKMVVFVMVIPGLLMIENQQSMLNFVTCFHEVFSKVDMYILRRPQNFAKSSPYFSLALHRTKLRWRFRKIVWPSQIIWTRAPPELMLWYLW